MGFTGNIVSFALLVIAIISYTKIKAIFDFPEKPHVGDVWWGPGTPSKTDTSIKPFKIKVSDDVSIFPFIRSFL